MKNTISASKVAEIIPGHNDFENYNQSLQAMLANTRRGVCKESNVREWYYHNIQPVSKGNLKTLDSDKRVRAIPDGLTIDGKGIIEIKCPKYFYQSLKAKIDGKEDGSEDIRVTDGQKSDHPYEFRHIYTKYYDQIQTTLQVCGKEYCDFVVYSCYGNEEMPYHVERIPRNDDYWNEIIYPAILKYFGDK